ncbi:MAG: hypothetical protein WC831_04340 [Parcubacteria group bacterium]|jgi:hypothetical protein
MGIESGTKIERPDLGKGQESGVMMSEIAPYLDQETRELGIDDSSKASTWRKRAGALMLAGTVLAGAMAGNVKKAEAGPHFSQGVEQMASTGGQRAMDDIGRSVGNTLSRIIGGGATPEEQRRMSEQILRERQDAINYQRRMEEDRVRQQNQMMQNLVQGEYQRYNNELQQISQQKAEADRLYMQGQLPENRYNEVMNNLKQRESDVRRQFSGGGAPAGQWRK